MKTYIALYFRKIVKFILWVQFFSFVLGIAVSLYYYYTIPNSPMLDIFLIIMYPIQAFVAVLFIFHSFYRAAGHVLIEKNTIQSVSFFNRSWHIVSLNQPVYYSLQEIYVRPKKSWYIVLSNEPFDPLKISLLTYNVRKQIVFPYNNDTIPLLPVNCWNHMA